MTKTFDLTANELRAAMILVGSCLDGMGGKRPSDLESDEYTWVSAHNLMANGYSRHEATGTFGSLMEKGMVDVVDDGEWALSTDGWRFLDTLWDATMAEAANLAANEAVEADPTECMTTEEYVAHVSPEPAPLGLVSFTDAELANALHFLDAHDALLEDDGELDAWNTIRAMVIRVATNNRELDKA